MASFLAHVHDTCAGTAGSINGPVTYQIASEPHNPTYIPSAPPYSVISSDSPKSDTSPKIAPVVIAQGANIRHSKQGSHQQLRLSTEKKRLLYRSFPPFFAFPSLGEHVCES